MTTLIFILLIVVMLLLVILIALGVEHKNDQIREYQMRKAETDFFFEELEEREVERQKDKSEQPQDDCLNPLVYPVCDACDKKEVCEVKLKTV